MDPLEPSLDRIRIALRERTNGELGRLSRMEAESAGLVEKGNDADWAILTSRLAEAETVRVHPLEVVSMENPNREARLILYPELQAGARSGKVTIDLAAIATEAMPIEQLQSTLRNIFDSAARSARSRRGASPIS